MLFYPGNYDGQELVSSATHDKDPYVLIKASKRLRYSLGINMPDITKDYELVVKFKASGLTQRKNAEKTRLYKTTEFAQAYTYEGELGAIYTKEFTVVI